MTHEGNGLGTGVGGFVGDEVGNEVGRFEGWAVVGGLAIAIE